MKQMLWLLPLYLLLGCDRGTSYAGDSAARTSEDTRRENPALRIQDESEIDRNLSQNVRDALRTNSSLSTNSEKITVSTRNGTVTLRGIVSSAAEKQSIVAMVENLVGVKDCDDQLQVGAN